MLAPEQTVVLETGPDQARSIARGMLTRYLTLPNYSRNWLRLGFQAITEAPGFPVTTLERLAAALRSYSP